MQIELYDCPVYYLESASRMWHMVGEIYGEMTLWVQVELKVWDDQSSQCLKKNLKIMEYLAEHMEATCLIERNN